MSVPPQGGSGGLFGDLEEPSGTAPQEKPSAKAAKKARKKAAPKKKRAKPVEPRSLFAHVALHRPLRTEFTYGVPDELIERCRAGVRVTVPFGPKREVGVVIGTTSECDVPPARLRDVQRVLDAEPVVDAYLLSLTRWMADEYACAWGEALAAILPAPMKHDRGTRKVLKIAALPEAAGALAELEASHEKQHRLLRTLLEIEGEVGLRDLTRKLELSDAPARSLERRGLVRIRAAEFESFDSAVADVERVRPEQLSDDQIAAVEAIEARLGTEAGGAFLLHGVTGSGKTEVYLRTIERALEQGLGAIQLVPEIALTPQTVGWFQSRFGDVAVLHSRMTDSQRLTAWRRVASGETRVVVGARSAIFAPVRDLGVIIVDEEHEPSFKQGNAPRYHARDVALKRARGVGAVCILGSATPSLESWIAVERAELTKLELPTRVGQGQLPDVSVVDMRNEPPGRYAAIFSAELRQRIDDVLDKGEQAILFLNRRGYAPVMWCHACRDIVRCHQCDSTITWHRRIQRLVCHLCGHEQRVPSACPSCTAPGLRMLGVGSERVERALKEMRPDARVRRMDSDTMHRREDYESTLSAFGRGEVDVLVGTQMIAKGLDFPNVTLVGIVSADTGLHIPDFRAAERTFQLLAQVSGRAGRGQLSGHIVVQTESADHPAIRCAAAHDYPGFVEAESELRRELGYPPFGRLIRIVFEHEDEARAASAADGFARALREKLEREPGNVVARVQVLGPAPAPLALLRGRTRHHVLVKTPCDPSLLAKTRGIVVECADEVSGPRVLVDVDPVSML